MSNTKPAVHFIIGSIGAGKTTYARKLGAEHGALVFSIDEWMQDLFAPDLAGAGFAAIAERTQRVRRTMWRVAEQALALGRPVVFDTGLLTAADRATERGRAAALGIAPQTHYLATSAATRWRHVAARNAARDGGFAFEIPRPIFDFIETIWQPPDAQEKAAPGFVTVDIFTAA